MFQRIGQKCMGVPFYCFVGERQVFVQLIVCLAMFFNTTYNYCYIAYLPANVVAMDLHCLGLLGSTFLALLPTLLETWTAPLALLQKKKVEYVKHLKKYSRNSRFMWSFSMVELMEQSQTSPIFCSYTHHSTTDQNYFGLEGIYTVCFSYALILTKKTALNNLRYPFCPNSIWTPPIKFHNVKNQEEVTKKRTQCCTTQQTKLTLSVLTSFLC